MKQVETCGGCDGNGYVRCPVCEGAGLARKKPGTRQGSYFPEKVECQSCQGIGRIICKICDGVGKSVPDKKDSSKE